MPIFDKQDFLSELIDRTDLIASNVQSFLRLGNEELNYKPDDGKWSIAEIFDHLNRTHALHLKSVLAKITNAPDIQELTYNSGWLGDWVYGKIVPRPDGSVLKIKVPKILHPAGKELDGKEVLDEFLQQMDTMHDIVRHASTKDLEGIRIPFSFAGAVKLRLGDMLRYLVAYSERYVLQAQRVMIPVV
jgi:DinB superfamily